MSSDVTAAPCPPDLATARFMVVTASVLPCMYGGRARVAVHPDLKSLPLYRVPVADPAGGRKHTGRFRLLPVVQFGTIDELVEMYRTALTRAVEVGLRVDAPAAPDSFQADAWAGHARLQAEYTKAGLTGPVAAYDARLVADGTDPLTFNPSPCPLPAADVAWVEGVLEQSGAPRSAAEAAAVFSAYAAWKAGE